MFENKAGRHCATILLHRIEFAKAFLPVQIFPYPQIVLNHSIPATYFLRFLHLYNTDSIIHPTMFFRFLDYDSMQHDETIINFFLRRYLCAPRVFLPPEKFCSKALLPATVLLKPTPILSAL